MIAAIIQARTGSTRLPGKVLKRAVGKTMLELMIERVRRARKLDAIVIATSTEKRDTRIADIAERLGVGIFRGSEKDVLDRYYQAAQKFGADIVMRLTSDCPLMDPCIVDTVADFYLKKKNQFDYVSNVRPLTFPEGMDVEIFSFRSLEKAWKESSPREREHVTTYIGKHQEIFRIGNVFNEKDLSHFRLTLDYKEDLILIQKLFRVLYPKNQDFTMQAIVSLLEARPDFVSINRRF